MFKLFSFNDWLSEGGNANLRSLALNSAYEQMCWVKACVYRIATSASTAPLKFYEGKPGAFPTYNEKEAIKDKEHPVYNLFNPPKPPTILSLGQLMQRTFIHTETDGLYFWLIERKKGIATNLDVRLSTELQAILEYKNNNPTRAILVGWQDTDGKRYLPQDVLPISNYDPKNELSGLSPLKAARLSIESEYSISGWNASFFKSGMKSPVLVQAKGQLTREQRKEIRAEVVNYYSGIDGGHGALLMQGGVEIKPLTVNPKDIDFINGKKLNREEILAVFGVPPAMVGIFEYANYSNVREQIRIFWEHTLLPKMNYVLELIQFNILDRDFPGVYAEWDLSGVAGLAPDPIEIANPAKTYRDMGYSPSQISRILNYPELEPDKDFKEPQQPQAPAQQPQQNPKKPPKDPSASDPKPSDKPKPDNNNAFKNDLIKQIRLFTQYVPLENGPQAVLKLWEDLIEQFLLKKFEGIDLLPCRSLPQLLIKNPTEDMRREFSNGAEKIAEVLVSSIYNVHSRL